MSNRTKEINKITTTIIGISVKLIIYALIVLLLYEAVARGYAFGHEIFFAEAVDEAPGTDMTVQIDREESVAEAAEYLSHKGLIKSEFAFIFQSRFYDYDTIYPGTYTLNTAMTSKEILQLLNEKPEDGQDVKPARSGGGKAAAARTEEDTEGKGGSEAPAAAPAAASETGAPGLEDGSAAGGESQDGLSGQDGLDSQDGQANEQTYEGEDQEMEGGWIEDATEDGNQ